MLIKALKPTPKSSHSPDTVIVRGFQQVLVSAVVALYPIREASFGLLSLYLSR